MPFQPPRPKPSHYIPVKRTLTKNTDRENEQSSGENKQRKIINKRMVDHNTPYRINQLPAVTGGATYEQIRQALTVHAIDMRKPARPKIKQAPARRRRKK